MVISDIAIRRPVFTTMVTVGLMVLGALGFTRLGVDLFPDISFPVVVVTTVWPGAGPEEVETLVTRPIEDAVASVNMLDEMYSTSRDNVSSVVILFKIEADTKQAGIDIRDKIAQIRARLPRDIQEPVVSRADPKATPVITYALATPAGAQETRRLAEDVVKPAMERVAGVAGVNVYGGRQREIQVLLDGHALEAVGLSPSAVSAALQLEGVDLPGGRVTMPDREIAVRTNGRFQSLADIGEVVLVASGATQVRLRDVADIRDAFKDVRTITRVDGVESVAFEIVKQSDANTVDVADKVYEAVDRLKAALPEGSKVTALADSSVYIRRNIDDLVESIVYGGLMAVLVIFLFMLDWRSTLISALALPTSIVTTFLAMWVMGFTLNMISLMGLSLAIGLLIDDAVVVRENIFRHMERGEDSFTAARRGTAEIGLAVMATTFTVVAVFVPVAFTSGMVGRMFREFGLTVTAAVLVSLFISFTLDPMLSARLVKKVTKHREAEKLHPVLGVVNKAYDAVDDAYRRLLGWVLSGRGPKLVVVAASTVAFLGTMFIAVRYMSGEFMPQADRGEFTVSLELPPGSPLSQTDEMATRVEKLVREEPAVEMLYTTLGPGEEVNKATLFVRCTPIEKRSEPIRAIQARVRERLVALPGVTSTVSNRGVEGNTESPITLLVRGPDQTELARLAALAVDAVRSTPGAVDTTTNVVLGKPETRIQLDRRVLGDLGLSVGTVALGLRTAIEGDTPVRYREGEKDYDVRVRLRPEDRADERLLEELSFPSKRGRLVSLREAARLAPATGPGLVYRVNRQRTITVTANLNGRPLGAVSGEIKQKLKSIPLAPGYEFEWAGQAKRMAEMGQSMGLALAVAIVFIYLVLASQFESFVHPFTIMLALPLAVVGALLTLFLMDFALSMPAFIGIILLMGLVTKNGILLVDRANQQIEAGLSATAAMLEAGPTRLRPILMTSAAMVLGMLPAAISRASGSEMRAPMATAVIAGVVTSTFLTLLVVPVAYVVADRLRSKHPASERDPEAHAASDPPPALAALPGGEPGERLAPTGTESDGR